MTLKKRNELESEKRIRRNRYGSAPLSMNDKAVNELVFQARKALREQEPKRWKAPRRKPFKAKHRTAQEIAAADQEIERLALELRNCTPDSTIHSAANRPDVYQGQGHGRLRSAGHSGRKVQTGGPYEDRLAGAPVP